MNPPVMSPRNRYLFAAALIPIIAVLAIGIFTDQSGKAQEARPEGAPQYQIFDIGVVQTGDTASQGFGASAGGVAVGRSLRTGGAQALAGPKAADASPCPTSRAGPSPSQTRLTTTELSSAQGQRPHSALAACRLFGTTA
jgi:hypothetical protein